jgi:ATP-binding protein involved in chromosome partitioning
MFMAGKKNMPEGPSAELFLQKLNEVSKAYPLTTAAIIQFDYNGQELHVTLEVDPAKIKNMQEYQAVAEAVLAEMPNVTKSKLLLTAHKGAPPMAVKPTPQKLNLPGVRYIVPVASGKGGVGKSTTAVNLAIALQRLGHRVGLLDADIYGPSLPRMLGLSGKLNVTADKKIIPHEKWGIKAMSIGFMIPEDTPTIWRGPMVQGALQQMLRDVTWGDLDILVVDMPPGTGDAQLTMAQNVALAGAVIVSTPQDIALLDARKAIAMFRRVEVPILGLIENMSFFCCPHCGERSDIFSHGGAAAEAEKWDVPLLGEIPIDLAIRINADEGTPIVAHIPDHAMSISYLEIAKKLWDGLAVEKDIQAPRIVMQ